MEDSRKFLEKEAHELGVPWSPSTPDDQLVKLIEKRKGELAMGAPTSPPECFGLMWEAIGQSVCQGCSVKDPCLHEFAFKRIPALQTQMGAKANMQGLAEETGVSVEALEAAFQYAAGVGKGIPAPEKPKRAPVATPVPDAKPPEPAAVEFPESLLEDSEVADLPPPPDADGDGDAEVPPPADVNDEPDTEPDPVEEPEPEPAPKVKKEKKGKAKGKGKKSEANPPVTGSVQSASGPVSRNCLVATHVERAVAPELAPDMAWQWGDHTWQSRWERERMRSPAIAELTPGTKLKRVYQTKEHVVQVMRGSYRYLEHDYPTLYSVVKVITGTYEAPAQMRNGKRPDGSRQLCNWSALRFFNLRRSKKKQKSK